MTIETILILLAIGLFAGILSGMVGIGGGIVIVPALVYFLAYSQKSAQGTTLALLLLPVGILAVWQFYKEPGNLINIGAVGVLAVGFVIGGLFGSKLALSLSDDKLKRFFAIVIMLIAIKMLFFDKKKKAPQVDVTSIEAPKT